MTDFPPPVSRDTHEDPVPLPPLAPVAENVDTSPAPFSKMAIASFVIACISAIIFGFLGALAAALAVQSIRTIRRTGARGRGLAIAGFCVGLASFLFSLIARYFLM
ncbi:hypothetical protein JF66_09480 [Cryobacterium sp. MLB-32]|nr:hypothetical protein JF66_09480 [Cryobacterium sp. MLB-32]